MSKRFYHYDGQGSTQLLTDENGNVTDSYANTAYGTPVDTGAANPTVNPFPFVGQLGYYLDADTGNYYVRARTYSPVLAMWLSEDRLGFDSSYSDSMASYGWPAHDWLTIVPNWYRYAENDPAAFIDPSGLAFQPAPFPGLPSLPLPRLPWPPIKRPLPWLPPMPWPPSLPPESWLPPSPDPGWYPGKSVTPPPKGPPLPWWWGDPYYDPQWDAPGHARPSQNPPGGAPPPGPQVFEVGPIDTGTYCDLDLIGKPPKAPVVIPAPYSVAVQRVIKYLASSGADTAIRGRGTRTRL
jgi:RHS repeat-associated protein